jgi:hypothetical protein
LRQDEASHAKRVWRCRTRLPLGFEY